MPIVSIDALPPHDSGAIPQMMVAIQNAGAKALNCEPNNIWVMFRPTQHGHYLRDNDPFPPVVTVRAQSGRTAELCCGDSRSRC